MIGIITGSGLYDLTLENSKEELVATKWGEVTVTCGILNGREVGFISRHGKGHTRLPNMINHRANIAALKSLGAQLIIGTTVCGVLKKEYDLGKLFLFNDIFFPDNRLPSGEICSIYTEEGDPMRGHLICGSHITMAALLALSDMDAYRDVTYGHANGPRFNSRSEITFMAQYADVVSQTCGPEAVLSGELEIPYVLLGFGVDYANGVSDQPTPIEELNANMAKSAQVFTQALQKLIAAETPQFEGFVYRF